MGILKYKLIKTKSQYNQYCRELESLLEKDSTRNFQDEIDLLTLLIEKWDSEHNSFKDTDPIRLLISLMEDHNMKSKDLVELLTVSKGYVSDILHYKKGLSKEVIRKLSVFFKVSQEAFNRPYKLKGNENSPARKTSITSEKKHRISA
jgi:HTH-type transcriptional regulator / antitoxin HigA